MSDLIRKAISLGIGITAVSREKAQQFVDEMVKKGDIAHDESMEVVNRLIARGEEQQNEMKRMVQDQVRKILTDMDIATKQDLIDLENKLSSSVSPKSQSVDPTTF
ncbi:MAG: polyhydroxyalkanoate synthesis regulator [Paenibacillaceae bacterium]